MTRDEAVEVLARGLARWGRLADGLRQAGVTEGQWYTCVSGRHNNRMRLDAIQILCATAGLDEATDRAVHGAFDLPYGDDPIHAEGLTQWLRERGEDLHPTARADHPSCWRRAVELGMSESEACSRAMRDLVETRRGQA